VDDRGENRPGALVRRVPIDVFPTQLKTLIEEASAALNVPHDYLALPMLALAGAAIGNARHIALTKSHTEPPILYAVIVGPPGTLKTPALKILRRPFDELQREKIDQWQTKMDVWEEQPKDGRGAAPVLERVVVSDTTVETLGLVLHENSRGVALIRDELSGLIASFNQYKKAKGADKQFYLSAWSGDTVLIDRKTERANRGGPLHVGQPFICIVGGVQPDVLPAVAGNMRRGMVIVHDGFVDRFAFSWPDPLPHVGERGLAISAEALGVWNDCVRELFTQEMVTEEDGHKRPYLVQLDQSGHEEWRQFTDRLASEMNAPSFPQHLVGPWSKLRGMAARIALILQMLRWSCDGGNESTIDGLAVRDATMVIAYLKDHARRVHACMGSDPRLGEARKVLQWILRERLPRFTTRDVYRRFRALLRNADELDGILRLLERHHYINPVGGEARMGAGRTPSPAWIVNPAAHDDDE
jgi:Protein of unknown function (DUF3987)